MEIERIYRIQRYLTVIILQDTRLNKYFHLLENNIFGKYAKVWEYVKKNGNGKEPDLVDTAESCWLSNPSEIIEMAFEEFSWDPIRYLYELLDAIYFSDKKKISIDEYKNLVSLKDEIEKIKQWDVNKWCSIGEILSTMYDEYSEWWFDKSYSSWIPEIDEITGWFKPGTVTRITAYSNTGKSKFAYFLASNLLKQWNKVLFINLEVQKDTVAQNILASYSGIHIKDVIRESGISWLGDYLNEYNELPLYIEDSKWDWESIKNLVESNNPEVLFIDFIQNIEISWNSSYEQMSKLAKRIQRLAIDMGIVIIDVSQMSNDGAKNYKIGDLIPSKWWWELVASTDVWFVMTPHDMLWDHINLYIAKNKFGRKEDCIEFKVDFKLNRFSVIGTSKKKTFSN